MKTHSILILTLFTSILFSCSSDPGKSVNAKDTTATAIGAESFETGVVIEKVVNLTDASQSYALYLPASYSVEKTYPVIYAFDAHGTGKLPVSMYKSLADKYGYILIGSNNSKNGISWDQSQTIANKLFSDSQQRLSINTSRIYVIGFSGGARVANAICITNGAIAGVICCGAASPAANNKDPRSNYTFLGICGNKDFNYIEMRKYDMIELAGRPVKHAFIEFDGKHEWPGEDVMKDAFLWCELGAIRKDPSLKNEAFINENILVYSNKIKEAQKNNKTFEVYNLTRRTINFFDGLTDLKEYYEIYNPLKSNQEVDKQLKKEGQIWKQEEEMKGFYSEAFQSKNIDWWKQDIASMNKKIKSGNTDDVLMYKRTLDYLSLVAYMQTTGALQQRNLPAAKMFCQIDLTVDPTNSESHYLNAIILAIEGKDKETILSLEDAVKNGFKDIERLQNDNAFVKIKTTDAFKAILKKINESGISDSAAN
jgi:dienelactone hydrolase